MTCFFVCMHAQRCCTCLFARARACSIFGRRQRWKISTLSHPKMYFGSWQFVKSTIEWKYFVSSLNFLTEKILQLEADLTEQDNTAVVTLNLWWIYALQFLFDRRIAFFALLVQHCSVSCTKCFHCFLALLRLVMAILSVNRRFYVSDSWCKILAWGSWNYELVRILLINWIRDWFLARMVYSTLCALSVFIWWRKILAWGCWNWACSNTLDQWDCR